MRIKTGGLVDPVNSFNYCTFRYGPSTGRLLTIDNNETITIDHASFPVPGTVGSYNVAKTVNQGSVTFTNYSGDFSGASYELDTYNRIHWTPTGVPPITDIHIERMGVSGIRLWWTYPYTYTEFRVYSSTSPDGPFTYAGYSTTMQWIGTASADKTFYHVKVYVP